MLIWMHRRISLSSIASCRCGIHGPKLPREKRKKHKDNADIAAIKGLAWSKFILGYLDKAV